MVDTHKAILNLYPSVVTVDDTAGALDKDNNKVEIDQALVNAWVDPNAWFDSRKEAYPSWEDQLDMQYWDGVNDTTTWADAIAKVKADNPKGDA